MVNDDAASKLVHTLLDKGFDANSHGLIQHQ